MGNIFKCQCGESNEIKNSLDNNDFLYMVKKIYEYIGL
jgi:hypothetical protein